MGFYKPSPTLDFQRRAHETGVIDLTATGTATGTGRAAAAYSGASLQNSPKKREEHEFSLLRFGKRRTTLETTSKATYAVTLETKWSQGTFRWAHKGQYTPNPRLPFGLALAGSQNGQLCVLKEFKTGSVYKESFFKDDIRAVEKAAEIIQAFNRESAAAPPTVDAANKMKTVHLNRPQGHHVK